MPSFGDGGAERMLVNLSREFALRGFGVDFLINRASGPYLSSLPTTIRIVELGSSRQRKIIGPLIRYLLDDDAG